jgi:hypothetical protein
VGDLRFRFPSIPDASRPSIIMLIADMGASYFFSSSLPANIPYPLLLEGG